MRRTNIYAVTLITSLTDAEKKHLRPYHPPLELVIVTETKVNPSSLVSVVRVYVGNDMVS